MENSKKGANMIDSVNNIIGHWVILIAGYGGYLFYGTEQQAEDERARKALYEGVIGKKRTEYKVVSSNTITKLNRKINTYLSKGWKIVSSHKVIITSQRYHYRRSDLINITNTLEYSQTIILEMV